MCNSPASDDGMAPRKSRPSLVSVPVLSKQNTLILPEMAMRLGLRQLMPFFCRDSKHLFVSLHGDGGGRLKWQLI